MCSAQTTSIIDWSITISVLDTLDLRYWIGNRLQDSAVQYNTIHYDMTHNTIYNAKNDKIQEMIHHKMHYTI